VRIRVKDHRAGAVFAPADVEAAFEDVPDLREIVPVQRMVRARCEAQDTGVGLGGPFRPRVEQHLPGLARPANRFPFELIAVSRFHRLVFGHVISVQAAVQR
jgi:hypothetical protein